MILKNKRLLLGVTGSIAAYKAADLASKLTQAGALVDVVLTDAAVKFVTPLTFQSVTGRKAYTDLWGDDAHVIHVGLAETADLLVIAPATADTIAKLAHGPPTICSPSPRWRLVACSLPGDGCRYVRASGHASEFETLQERGAIIVARLRGAWRAG